MTYVLVLLGSLFGICALLGARLLLRNREVRQFVRETKIVKTKKSPRTSAIELQQVRSLVRLAEKALAQNRIEGAERLFIQALTIQPLAFDVQAQIAKLYLTTERESKAEAMYKELLQHRDDVSF